MSAYEVHESSSSANQDVVKIFYGNKVLLISQEILDRPTGQKTKHIAVHRHRHNYYWRCFFVCFFVEHYYSYTKHGF